MSIITEYRMADCIPSFNETELRQLTNGRIVYKDTPNHVGDVMKLYYKGPMFVVCRWDAGRTSFRKMSGAEFEVAEQQGLPMLKLTRGRAILIDIATCGLTVSQFFDEVDRQKDLHPDMDLFMDGEYYAVCGEKRRSDA